MQTHTFRAMGSQIMLVLDSEARWVSRLLRQSEQWFRSWEQQLSRFNPESELSQLNRSYGRSVRVSPVLAENLELAVRAMRNSAGLVTPTVLPALEQAGYDRSFEELGQQPVSKGSMAPARSNPMFQFDPHTRRICLAAGTRLDLGGIAKGWAADTTARRLGQYAPVLVDAGGDVAVSGAMEDGQGWPIGIADPACEGNLGVVELRAGGIATSGIDYRQWQVAGQRRHHIIDPRTARPACTDLVSVTVVAASTAQAEVAAKTVLILGSDAGQIWLAQRPALAAFLVGQGGQTVMNRRMANLLVE